MNKKTACCGHFYFIFFLFLFFFFSFFSHIEKYKLILWHIARSQHTHKITYQTISDGYVMLLMFNLYVLPITYPFSALTVYISNDLNLFSYTWLSEILGNYPVMFYKNDFWDNGQNFLKHPFNKCLPPSEMPPEMLSTVKPRSI